MIYESIKKLITYAMDTGLIAEPDRVYCTNRLLDALGYENLYDMGGLVGWPYGLE